MTDTEHPPTIIAEERDAFSSLALIADTDAVRIELEFDRDWEPPHSLDIPWPAVLKEAPRAALIAALALRPGVTTRVLGKDTTLYAEIVTMSQRRMERDRETITGPCTVMVIDPEGT